MKTDPERSASVSPHPAAPIGVARGAPSNPLQLGTRVYDAQEAVILITPLGSSNGQLRRVTFTPGSGTVPVTIDTTDTMSFAELSLVLDFRAAPDGLSRRQEVLALRSTPDAVALDVLGWSGSAMEWRTYAPPAPAAQRIVGRSAPPASDGTSAPAPPIVLAGSDKTSTWLYAFTPESGAALRWEVPLKRQGAVVHGALVRRQRDAFVVLVVTSGGDLVAYALSLEVLRAKEIRPADVMEARIGAIGDGAPVSATVAQALPGTSDQQLLVTFAGASGAAQLALVGFTADGALAKVAAPALNTSFATVERPVFRVAAADLNMDGVDEIVVAFTATYGQVAGAVALLLIAYALEEDGLVQRSEYAVANTGGQSLASIDLHIAAGVFGQEAVTNGVLVLGAGGSAGHIFHNKADVLAGVVPVDPDRTAFPPLGSEPAVLPAITSLGLMPASYPRFFGVAADLPGIGVTLGAPTFREIRSNQQLLAILTAPPYEASVSSTPPKLTFTSTSTGVEGYSVDSSKTWTTSRDAGSTIDLGAQITHGVSKSYGKSFDKTRDSSTTTSTSIESSITDEDLLLVYATDYWVWEYPILSPARSAEPSGTLLVLFPAQPSPVQSVVPAYASGYGYCPPFEKRSLLTYFDAPMDGQDAEGMMFEPRGLTVNEDEGSQVTYDKVNSNEETVNKTFNVLISTTDSTQLTLETKLFLYLPVSFGLEISKTQSYSDEEVTTTSLSRTLEMSLVIAGGSVKDVAYSYIMTPYVYQHKKLGCMVVAYDVDLSVGLGWKAKFNDPWPMLIMPFRGSTLKLLACFSRSIRFSPQPDASVLVLVEVFNRAYQPAEKVTCDFYAGQPIVDGSGPVVPPKDKLGTVTIPLINALARETAPFSWVGAKEGDHITVVVSGDKRPPKKPEIGWAVYPLSAFKSVWNRLAAERPGAVGDGD